MLNFIQECFLLVPESVSLKRSIRCSWETHTTAKMITMTPPPNVAHRTTRSTIHLTICTVVALNARIPCTMLSIASITLHSRMALHPSVGTSQPPTPPSAHFHHHLPYRHATQKPVRLFSTQPSPPTTMNSHPTNIKHSTVGKAPTNCITMYMFERRSIPN